MLNYMYILECSDVTYYTGSTINLDRRLMEHQTGKGAKHTKTRLPVRLVYCLGFMNIADAFDYEHRIKKWSHAKKKALADNYFELLPKLSECKNKSHFKNHKKQPSSRLRSNSD